MAKQLDLLSEKFDKDKAQELKDQSIDLVEAPVRVRSWIEDCLPCVIDIANEVDEFTTDRVEWQLGKAGIAAPKEKRAFGALMRRAASCGYIEKTDRTHISVMPSNHRRPKSIWRSLIRSQS